MLLCVFLSRGICMRTKYKISEELLEFYNDEFVHMWLDDVATSDKTLKGYLHTIKKYCNYIEKSPSEFLQEADDEEETKKMKFRSIKKYMIGFKKIMTDGGELPDGTIQEPLAPKTVNQYISIIKSFYVFNEITFPNLNIKTAYKKIENDTEIKKSDLKNALDFANPSQKLAIHIGCSSGLAISDILNLKISDIKDKDENGITTIHLHRQKSNVPFFTFLSPETTEAVQTYIKYRNSYGTSAKKHLQEDWHEKRKVRSDDGYLIIAEQISDKYLENYDDELRGVSPNIFIKYMRSLAQKSGVELTPKTYSKIRSHVFRKYFFSTLINNECSDMVAKFLCGKTVYESDGTYYKPDISKLKKQYMTYLPDLSFDDTQTRVIMDRDYLELQKQHEDGVKQLRLENQIEMVKLNLKIELQPFETSIAIFQNQIDDINMRINRTEIMLTYTDTNDDSYERYLKEKVAFKSAINDSYKFIKEEQVEMDALKAKYDVELNTLQEQLMEFNEN